MVGSATVAAVQLTVLVSAALLLCAASCCVAACVVPVSSVGVEADAADVERLLKELEGKDIHELIAAGEWLCVFLGEGYREWGVDTRGGQSRGLAWC